MYKNTYDKVGTDITVRDFLDQIVLGKHQNLIEQLRSEADKEKQDKYKKDLPAATIAGTLEVNNRTNEGVVDYSGLMAIDFDYLNDELDETCKQLCSDPYSFAVWVSCRGKGLCVLVKIQPERWEDAFLALERYYLEKYGRFIDPSCKNKGRLRYVSYDPNLFTNEESLVFRQYLKASERKKSEKPISDYVHTNEDIEHVISQIESRQLNLTDSYDDWFKMGFAFVAGYGANGREFFHRVSQFSPKYEPEECNKQYDYLLRYGAKQITIATFYHVAKSAGLDIMTPRTKEIVSISSNSKKNKVSLNSAVDTLAKMLDIPHQESRPIVEQVYNATGSIDTQETIYEQTIRHIQLQHALFFNLVSRRIEKPNGIIFNGKWEVNELFNELLILFDGKLGRQAFESLLFSHKTVPPLNPLQQFFIHHRDRKPVGVIAQLAATIETDTGWEGNGFDPTYTEYFFRKWLIGLVALAFDNLCDLMLILTGPQNIGKTEFFRRLLPDGLQRYFAETKLDRGKDDEILLCENWIVFLDELSGKSFQDVGLMKNLLSAKVFDLREPYGSTNVKLRRRAALCGSSNPQAILSDPTGNRRIIPINVLSINRELYNTIDKTDLLMEAYHAYTNGEGYSLSSDDIRRLEEETGSFKKWSIERQLLECSFAKPTGEGGEVVEHLELIQIHLSLESRAGGRRLESDKIRLELAAMGLKSYQKRFGKDPQTKKQRRPWVYDVLRLDNP
ncbi:BT4734/BF3469 family protein [Spirosoma humi]